MLISLSNYREEDLLSFIGYEINDSPLGIKLLRSVLLRYDLFLRLTRLVIG